MKATNSLFLQTPRPACGLGEFVSESLLALSRVERMMADVLAGPSVSDVVSWGEQHIPTWARPFLFL